MQTQRPEPVYEKRVKSRKEAAEVIRMAKGVITEEMDPIAFWKFIAQYAEEQRKQQLRIWETQQ
jgi:hypothetical protein